MHDVLQTKEFDRWFKSLRDDRAVARIASALDRIQLGLIGDWKSVGSGVSELRINYGPGYRLYFTLRNGRVVVLLCGGSKSSQKRDIDLAKKLKEEYDG